MMKLVPMFWLNWMALDKVFCAQEHHNARSEDVALPDLTGYHQHWSVPRRALHFFEW